MTDTESPEIKNTPDYGTPESVLAAIELMQAPERVRARNRAKVDSLINGELPFTPAEVAEFQIPINVNWGEGRRVLLDVNSQLNNAFLHKDGFATYTLLEGKLEKRDEWSSEVTTDLNRIKKRGESGIRNMFLIKDRNASLGIHGIGVVMWMNSYDWMGRFMPLEDLLIPTGTHQSFTNMTQFGANLYMTPYELMTMTQENSKEAEESGWNIKAVRQILAVYGKLNDNPQNYNWNDRPEEMVNVWKQNQAACNNDAVPKVNLAVLYYRSPEGGSQNKEKWYRKICLKDVAADAQGYSSGLKLESEFIFDSGKRVFADSIRHILHVQYGDCNLVPPHTYHSTIGVGKMIFAPTEYMNRLRCRWLQHVDESMLMLIRIQNPQDKDRPKVFNLRPYGVIEEGVTIVPKEERHQIDPRLIESAMSENRQIISETSASYVQDIDNGTGKEQTLGEAQIRLQSANKMIGAMLEAMFTIETFKEEEEFRRFLLPNPTDPDVISFQQQWEAHGIPKELMKPKCWQVDVNRVSGGGDKTLALQENQLLMSNLGRYDPSSQRMIIRSYTGAVTGDYAKARLLVPEQENQVTDGRKAAEDVFGTLMSGAPVGLREGIEQQDYVTAMMEMFNAIIQRIEGTDQLGTPQDVIGLNVVANDIGQHLELMSQNPESKEFVTAVGKELGKQMNLVKAYQQRQQEKSSEAQPDPEAIAKAQATTAAAQQKLQINEANFEQKMTQSEAKFAQKMQQQSETQNAKMQQMLAEALAEIKAFQAKTTAEIEAIHEKSSAAPAVESK